MQFQRVRSLTDDSHGREHGGRQMGMALEEQLGAYIVIQKEETEKLIGGDEGFGNLNVSPQ